MMQSLFVQILHTALLMKFPRQGVKSKSHLSFRSFSHAAPDLLYLLRSDMGLVGDPNPKHPNQEQHKPHVAHLIVIYSCYLIGKMVSVYSESIYFLFPPIYFFISPILQIPPLRIQSSHRLNTFLIHRKHNPPTQHQSNQSRQTPTPQRQHTLISHQL